MSVWELFFTITKFVSLSRKQKQPNLKHLVQYKNEKSPRYITVQINCLPFFFLECKMAGTATSSQCAEVTLKNLISKLQIKLSECQRKDIVIIISTSSNLWLYIVLTKKIFYTKPNDLITSQILE